MEKNYKLKIISPCKKLCQLTKTTKVCKGCGRTIDEIGRWSQMSNYQREVIMKRIENIKP